MHQIKLFNTLIVIELLVYLLWHTQLWHFNIFNPDYFYNQYFTGDLRDAVIIFGKFIYVKHISFFIFGLNLVATIGLFFYKRTFRVLLIATVLFGFFEAFLHPINQLTSIDVIMVNIINLIKGAIIYMAYFSAVALRFGNKKHTTSDR